MRIYIWLLLKIRPTIFKIPKIDVFYGTHEVRVWVIFWYFEVLFLISVILYWQGNDKPKIR